STLLCLGWATMAAGRGWHWAVPACLLAGCGYYAMQNLLNLQATLMYPSLRGTAMSLFAAALFGGIALGVSVAAMVIAHTGYRTVFSTSAVGVLAVSAAYAQLLARRGEHTTG